MTLFSDETLCRLQQRTLAALAQRIPERTLNDLARHIPGRLIISLERYGQLDSIKESEYIRGYKSGRESAKEEQRIEESWRGREDMGT